MTTILLDRWLLLIYFIYGLAFFGMGLAMALESGRSPGLAEVRVLRPLAVFGLLHGGHEWFEAYLLIAGPSLSSLASWLPWLRIVTLSLSFLFLFLFAYNYLGMDQARRPRGWLSRYRLLGLYWLALAVWGLTQYPRALSQEPAFWDAMVRYFLAMPASLLAALALQGRSRQSRTEDRPVLAWFFFGASVGFALYAVTQVFVRPLEVFPANLINQANFAGWTGISIQMVRSLLAVLITFCLIRAAQAVEEERNLQIHIIQQARLEALQQREALRRQLLQHTVQAQEEERARIARELHDETSQVLSAFSLELAALDSGLRRQPQSHSRVERLQDLTRQVSQGIYRLVGDLRPAHLDDFGLVPAINYLLEQARRTGIEFDLQVRGAPRRLDLAVETVLFRVAQEAITNITRHSGAKHAALELCFNEFQVQLTASDDGRGFDPSAHFQPPRGWGLEGMRERLEASGGSFSIRSAPGRGTHLTALIPLDAHPLEMEKPG